MSVIVIYSFFLLFGRICSCFCMFVWFLSSGGGLIDYSYKTRFVLCGSILCVLFLSLVLCFFFRTTLVCLDYKIKWKCVKHI